MIVKELPQDKDNTQVILLEYKAAVGLSIGMPLTEWTASAEPFYSVANKHIISFWGGF